MKPMLKISTAIILAVFFAACGSEGRPIGYESDTHGRGKAVIYVEESFKPLFDTSIYTFESQFPHADIEAIYSSEGKIMEAFFQNKTKTICISRDFTDAEKAQLRKQNVEVRSDKVAQDAVTLIVNPANMDTLMTVQRLKRILTGKDTIWQGLKTRINVVYDRESSANFNFLRDYCGKNNIPINILAVNGNEEVINYVKKNKSALGVIGLNWISDQDDFDVLDFVNGITVVSLAKSENDDYFKPYAAFVYTKEYPLTREIWLFNKGKKSGLNTGFVLFMIGEKGQTIVQKSALVPATAPIRLIQMTTD
ncbi:MAG: PstS family phosphate ABC transporter substrate-binding protein [Flavobacteriales bacterium]